jgi:hypothetical protein
MENEQKPSDRPEQNNKGLECVRSNGWQNAISFAFKKILNSVFTKNQFSNFKFYNTMKKQLTLILVFAVCAMTACDDNDPVVLGYPTESLPKMVVSSVYPSEGRPGSTVVIFGENFGSSIEDHFVKFGAAYAEITDVGYGTIYVKVPMNLQPGEYEISIIANGRLASAPRVFKVIEQTNKQ